MELNGIRKKVVDSAYSRYETYLDSIDLDSKHHGMQLFSAYLNGADFTIDELLSRLKKILGDKYNDELEQELLK
jgi:hypothetical protein